jgi:ABC-type Fe3+-hydroxamate transport system substrate-binding protein
MSQFTDQLGNIIQLVHTPKRIISLVPSQTELLFDLGLDEEVIGITKFCVHPEEWFRTKTRVGGTKTVEIDKIRSLQPDLIIANKEENVKEQIEGLQEIAPVWISDINNLPEALEMIKSVGELTTRNKRALELADNIKSGFQQLPTTNHQLKTAYLIWKDPYMTVGGDTFISDMMKRCGFHNVFGDQLRYPEVALESIKASGCELLFLSSEPYPFKERHVQELKAELPDTKVMLVDGEMFSWYGSRLQHAPAYFKQLLAHIHNSV